MRRLVFTETCSCCRPWRLTLFFLLLFFSAGGRHIGRAVATSLNVATSDSSCQPAQRGTLEFLYMTSFGPALNTSGSVIGMQMAVDRINANSSILPNYNLTHSPMIADSQCNRSISLAEYFEAINACGRQFIAVLGSGCSVATEPVAEIDHFWGLSHLSYASSAGYFQDTTRFRKYLQLFPTEDNLAPAIAALIRLFEWKRVGIITQREAIFIRSHDLIEKDLDEFGVTILSSTNFIETFIDPATIVDLFPENGRIFFLNAYEDKARQVLCQAFQRGMYGPNYLWILFGWYDEEWWKEPGQFKCTSEELYQVINRGIAVQHYSINDDIDKTVVGNLSYNGFLKEYSDRVRSSSFEEASNSHLAYDAVWTLAFALDEVSKQIKDNKISEECSNAAVQDTLDNWNYSRNATASCMVYEALLKTDFEGLSGRIVFDRNGIRNHTSVRFLQYRNDGKLTAFGFHSISANEVSFIDGENAETIFPDGIPLDGNPVNTITALEPALLGVVYGFAILGIFLIIICFVFLTMVNIKLGSIVEDGLNYFLLVGALLICVSLLFHNRETNDVTVILTGCYFRIWLSVLGFVVIYGSILAQMWKIYYLHLNPQKTSSLKMWHLMLFVCVLVFVMLFILTVGSAVPATRPEVTLADDLENPSVINEKGILNNFMFYRCNPPASNSWYAAIFIFLGILQIAEIVLMVQTRRVKLSDVKTTAVIIYTITIVFVIMVIVRFAFVGYPNTTVGMFAAGFIASSYTVTVTTFVRKLLLLLERRKGRQRSQSMASDKNGHYSTGGGGTSGGGTEQVNTTIGGRDCAESELKIWSLNQEIQKLTALLENKKKSSEEFLKL